MAQSTRASRALLFMQQCRVQATNTIKHHPRKARQYNSDSLNPSNFGKKLHLQDSPTAPLPSWRYARAAASDSTTPDKLDDAPQPKSTSTATPPRTYDFPRARDQPVPRYRHNPAIKPGFWSFVKYRVLRVQEPTNPNDNIKPAFNVLTNPYRAQKAWPPVLTNLPETEQFHYEKKFRRRLLNKTKAMRYTWDTWALFLRRFSVGFLIFYFALVAEPGDPNTRVPPDGLRYWLYGKLREGNEYGLWGRRLGGWFEKQYAYYRIKHKKQWDPYNMEGWDVTRERNSLPTGKRAAPPIERALGDPTQEGF